MMMRSDNYFECACGSQVDCSTEELIRTHIRFCQNYTKSSPVSQELIQRNLDKLSSEDLKVIHVELCMWRDEIKANIRSRTEMKKQEFGYIDLNRNTSGEYDINKCDICKKAFDYVKLFFVDSCGHTFCRPCLANHVKRCLQEKKTPSCLTCKKNLQVFESKDLIGDELYEQLLEESIDLGLTRCVNCKAQFEFEPGKITGNVKDEHGKVLDSTHEQHYVQNRFKCPACSTEQCRQCKVVPYHIGKICDEYKSYKEAKLCRYCEEPIKQANSSFTEICLNIECQDKAKLACKKKLDCGHYCYGYVGEQKCTPCLDETCVKGSGLTQTGDDYCMICGVDRLINAPCIRSKCGHLFHLACITTRIQKRWHRPRITFNFCNCPLCKQWLEFPSDSAIQYQMLENLNLYKDIRWKAHERLKYENRLKDEKLVTQSSPYYNKPEDYAFAIYSYYQCYKCKKPYFGGLKSCEDLMQEDNKQGEFKWEELVCASCSDVGLTVENCNKHGKDFIEFKCKFCCSVAQWFCWGNTHFCDPCHVKQCNGDHLSKKKPSELPACKGKGGGCPLKIDHPPNGTEFALGCSLCRNVLNSNQNF